MRTGTQLSLKGAQQPPHFSAHVDCGQTVVHLSIATAKLLCVDVGLAIDSYTGKYLELMCFSF